MVKIKGPIKIKGFKASEFIKDKLDGKISLPFAATGWKSSKTPDGVDMSDKVKPKPKKKVKKVKEE